MDSDRDDDGYAHDDDAPRDLDIVRDPNAYWRRRFFILGAGVALLGMCAWLFPGGHPAAPRSSATAQAKMAALARQGVLPTTAYGSAWPGPSPKQTAAASATAAARHAKAKARPHPSVSPSVSPSPSPSPSVTASASASASGRGPSGPRCAASDIVLSLFTGQSSYGPGARPKFEVYAVSTSSRACTLNYGPGSVQVVVTRHGRVVWDSAACKPSSAPPVRFTLGVPQVVTITWNRRAGQPSGCSGSLPAGAAGTFDAVALTDGQSSQVRSFTLSR